MTTSFTIEKATLVSAMGLLSRVVEKRNTIPILAHVRLALDGNALTITATDLDMEAKTTVAVQSAAKGTTTMDGHMLYDVARKLADGAMISVAWDESSQAKITAGRARFTMNRLPAEDFPDLSAGDMTNRITMPAETLSQMLSLCSHAISTEETRYYLNGIYLHEREGKLIAVATDGHRLARMENAAPEHSAGMPGVLIPRKTALELVKMLGKDEITLELSPQKIRVTQGPTTLTSKLIDGTFPDYERVIPRNNSNHMLVKVKDMAQAVSLVELVSHEKSRGCKFDMEPGRLTLSMRNPDAGDAEEELRVDYKGAPMIVGFNSKYVADMLSTMGGEDVTLSFETAGSPCLVTGGAHDNLTIVLMPMRV
jgi:DNA polymerase-3 subunit beta